MYNDYKNLLFKIMMGKKGVIGLIHSIRVEGTVKIVISSDYNMNRSVVTIPRDVVDNAIIPYVQNGVVRDRGLKTGDYSMLVRQPCLWSGGIQPFIIEVSDKILITSEDFEWNVDATIRVTPEMCGPYDSDFNGDEMI